MVADSRSRISQLANPPNNLWLKQFHCKFLFRIVCIRDDCFVPTLPFQNSFGYGHHKGPAGASEFTEISIFKLPAEKVVKSH
jgi:hypothetical protein